MSDALPFLIVVAAVGVFLVPFYLNGKRLTGWGTLAKKYNLQGDPVPPLAPDPGIRGTFFAASYSHYLQGSVHGVPAVAFDYVIGWGRRKKVGSCAGMERREVTPIPPMPHLSLVHEGNWTFLYTNYPFLRRGRQLSADEIEKLWTALLNAPEGPAKVEPADAVPADTLLRPSRARRSERQRQTS